MKRKKASIILLLPRPVVLLLFLLTITFRMAASLSCVARYAVRSSSSPLSFSLVISSGSVVDFAHRGSPDSKGGKATAAAIVNAANEGCLGGGGVDGAIGDAGGPALLADRMKLPVLNGRGDVDDDGSSSGSSSVSSGGGGGGIRCRTGDAVITGPGRYGTLGVPYVIHAVGPNYMMFGNDLARGDAMLRGAYRSSMERAREAKLEAVAFSLISSGVFRGRHSKREVLKIGVEAIITGFDPYDELREVHLCAFSAAEEELLRDICEEIGLAKEENGE
mmetsp:Transcript_15055/g.32786  ORF Transcript_15055/g.32786 Transcript_15055/m.32786 type:complete len:277 (-) Transcript_15055:71-901(-)